MRGPSGPPGLLYVPHLLLCLLCLLPPPLQYAAGQSQMPKDQPLWALLEQYCHTIMTLTNLSVTPGAHSHSLSARGCGTRWTRHCSTACWRPTAAWRWLK
ncbi:corticotropin releasing hormone receptor 2, partial [Homo sapiens]